MCLIDFETWPVLAANRATWREAINGGLLAAGRPRRVAAIDTNRRIDALHLQQHGRALSNLAPAGRPAAAGPQRCPAWRPPAARGPLADVTNLPASLM